MKRIKLTLNLMFIVAIWALLSTNSYCQKTRSEIADKYKWDLTGILSLTPIGGQQKMPFL
jgi:hypothetical protein